jgi:hypothetical protein
VKSFAPTFEAFKGDERMGEVFQPVPSEQSFILPEIWPGKHGLHRSGSGDIFAQGLKGSMTFEGLRSFRVFEYGRNFSI